MEFLAKGIPVIANAIGGMVDYVRDGETGWLNHDCTGRGLAAIMRSLIDDPVQVSDLSERLVRERDEVVLSLDRHAREVEAIYEDVLRHAR